MAVNRLPPSWYQTPRGWALALVYFAVVVAVAFVSVQPPALPGVVSTPVPVDVYVYCVVGALVWGLATIVDQSEADAARVRADVRRATADIEAARASVDGDPEAADALDAADDAVGAALSAFEGGEGPRTFEAGMEAAREEVAVAWERTTDASARASLSRAADELAEAETVARDALAGDALAASPGWSEDVERGEMAGTGTEEELAEDAEETGAVQAVEEGEKATVEEKEKAAVEEEEEAEFEEEGEEAAVEERKATVEEKEKAAVGEGAEEPEVEEAAERAPVEEVEGAAVEGATEEPPERPRKPSIWAGVAREVALRPVAALPLAAGVYLLGDLVAGAFGGQPPTTATAVLALFVGLFVYQTYGRLGAIADTLRRTDDDGEETATDSLERPVTRDRSRWYRRPLGRALVVGYLVATLLVLGLTVDRPRLAVGLPAVAAVVPVDVYLYALLGATGRIFTELTQDRTVAVETLALRGLRLPAAMLLAGAVSLVVATPFGETPPVGLAGLAFLVGLYEGVAFDYVALAGDRLFPDVGGGETETD